MDDGLQDVTTPSASYVVHNGAATSPRINTPQISKAPNTAFGNSEDELKMYS